MIDLEAPMSSLRILLVGLLAVTLFGQTAQNAVPNPGALIDHAVQGIAEQSGGVQPRGFVSSFSASGSARQRDQVRWSRAGSTHCAGPELRNHRS
jgi:hypothetical protein